MPDQDQAPAKPAYFAQFDGDEIDGKVYKIGDEIDASVGAGTMEYLKGIGRIAVTKPAEPNVIGSTDKPLAEMNRSELEAAARSLIDLSDYEDDQLRNEIERRRALIEAEKTDGAAQNGQESQDGDLTDEEKASAERQAAYDAVKDKPLADLKTAELQLVAEVEGADLTDASNNEKRVAAIQAKRDAAA